MTDQPEPPRFGSLRVNWPRIRWGLRQILLLSPPKGDIYYGDTAQLYEAERARKGHWRREQAAVEGFLARLPQGLSVLDVPVGTGRFVEFYRARDHRVTGFDASRDMLAIARRRADEAGLSAEFTAGDATRLPYGDGAFDLVVSTRFLRHILPYALARQSLAEMARVCRGHAIIELGGNELFGWPVSEGRPMRDSLRMDRSRRMLRDAGFTILDEVVTRQRAPGRRRIIFLLKKTAD